MMLAAVPPSVVGLLWPISGNSSASMMGESPILISAWPMVSLGPGIRISSTAPNAFL